MKYIRKRFKPEKLILFGSRARGDYLEESDFDLLIVSDTFKNMSWRERIIEVVGDWSEKVSLEPICLTKAEFMERKNTLGLVGTAVREGVEV